MKLHIHRPHPKSWFHRKSKVVTVPEVTAATATTLVVVEPIVKVSRGKVVRECTNAIDDAYSMYARALKAADKEYTDKIQNVNSKFYAALRTLGRNSPELNNARKQYEADKAVIQKVLDTAISAAGAVLDLEIKHQNELMDDE